MNRQVDLQTLALLAIAAAVVWALIHGWGVIAAVLA